MAAPRPLRQSGAGRCALTCRPRPVYLPRSESLTPDDCEPDMDVVTPAAAAEHTGSKYLGVLVAAKYARELNALPRDAVPAGLEKKLTTRALETLAAGGIEFRLIKRRRQASL
jgi:DNA-directed RNA polymerase omega subunit